MSDRAATHAEIRHALRARGFSPLPLSGKAPVLKEWQKRTETSLGDIDIWSKLYPSATNTGILTQLTPAVDLDITVPDAAAAIEDLARGHFGEHGDILVRFGKPPKRAILLRTDEPFEKIVRVFTTPDGSEQKIEILASGQQVVVAGIHPDTQQPYSWFGGEPWTTSRETLPYVREADVRGFLDEATQVLVAKFGFTDKGASKRKESNGAATDGANWGALAENIRSAHNLHDSLRDLAAKLVASGMSVGAAVNFLRGLMDTSNAERDERWKARYREIPRLVDSAESKKEKAATPPVEPRTLVEVHDTFRRWLGDDYDFATLDAMLAVAASERLSGDPAWLLIISGPGNAKTETAQAASKLGAHVVSTLTSDAALLSATPRKQKAKTATGGLLRKIGERGILVIKDVTSILSIDRNVRAAILAALREIHDGQWVRNVGSDGGQTLTWKGRLVVIGACTTAWDYAHGVIATMGDRFVLIRSDSHKGRIAGGLRAMRNTGDETKMRAELADAVAGVVSKVNPDQSYVLTENELNAIVRAADLVTLARTGVETDYRGDIIDAHAPEMPTRFAKQLTQIVRGAIAIGMPRTDALKLVIRCARDSVPQLRLAILRDVAATPDTRVIDVRRRLQKPRTTIDRALATLHILGLLTCREEEQEHGGKPRNIRHYSLAADVDLTALAPLYADKVEPSYSEFLYRESE